MTTLDELRRLEQAATPGPWDTRGRGVVDTDDMVVVWRPVTGHPPDADLIAAARNALPALLRVAGIAQEVRAALHLNGVDTEAMRESLEDIEERLAAALAALEAADEAR